MSSRSMQIMASIYFLLKGIYKMSLDPFVLVRANKLSEITKVMSKVLMTQLEKIPTGQRWDPLSINKNSCNGLKCTKYV